MSVDSRQELRKKALVVHVVVYIMVNAILAAINYMFTPGYLWFYFALVPWGLGLLLHIVFTIMAKGEDGEKGSAKQRYFFTHLVVYLLVNALLAAVNFMFTPSVLWFIFPAIGWGIGIVLHGIFTYWGQTP